MIYVLAAVDAAAAAVLWWWSLSEDTGWRIIGPIATVALGLLIVCVLPAVILAYIGRALWLAALLAALPFVLTVYGYCSE